MRDRRARGPRGRWRTSPSEASSSTNVIQSAGMRHCLLVVVVLLLVCTPRTVFAQVLTIGETLGKGKSAVLLSDNVIYPGEGIPSLNIAYGMWVRGLHQRFDLYVSAGETTTEGETQGWIGGGGNLQIIKAGKVGVSFFTVASVPFNRRDQACNVLLNPALVASVPIGPKLFVYSGVNSLVPVGHRARGIFTPPDTKVNVPVGATYALGAWGLWGEVDIGPLHAVGIGLTRGF